MRNFLFIAVSLLLMTVAGCRTPLDTRFDSMGRAAMEEITPLLVQKGYCINFDFCAGEVHGIQPFKNRFRYSTTDVEDPVLLKKIERIVLKHFYNTPDIERIFIAAYRCRSLGRTQCGTSQSEMIFEHEFRKDK